MKNTEVKTPTIMAADHVIGVQIYSITDMK